MESDELTPAWHPAHALPFDRMFDDARYWLPAARAGEYSYRTFIFGEDLAIVAGADVSRTTAR